MILDLQTMVDIQGGFIYGVPANTVADDLGIPRIVVVEYYLAFSNNQPKEFLQ
jgi:hypothetical protein